MPEYENVLELVKKIGYYQFDYDDFIEAFKRRKSDFREDFNVSSLLRTLFEFSIIGYYRAGGSGFGGSEYVFKYNLNPASTIRRMI